MATIQNKGPFRSLVAQLDKLARHNRQGSFRTKARYYEACKRFCAYLATYYHLQKLENVSGKRTMTAAGPTRSFGPAPEGTIVPEPLPQVHTSHENYFEN